MLFVSFNLTLTIFYSRGCRKVSNVLEVILDGKNGTCMTLSGLDVKASPVAPG